MKLLFVSKNVETRIRGLKKNGKTGRALADKAEFIIERLTSGVISLNTDTAGSLTKYGEKRIRRCRKYDLGCGYRLITLQRGSTIYVSFLGSHDDCRRWLENNSRLKNIHPCKGKTVCVKEKKSKTAAPDENLNMELIPDDDFMHPVTERDLRRVFSGLAGNPGPQK